MSLLDAMTVDLPDIAADGIVLTKFEVSPELARASSMAAMFSPDKRGRLNPGTYTRLDIDGELWMSDTPDEKFDHLDALHQARARGGRILVNGLGMGMVIGALLSLDNVEHVDVVELDPRIVKHIGPLYTSERCTIHHADAMTMAWPVGTRWTVAWHDIWLEAGARNLPDMHRLHRMYGGRVDWQGSWGRWWAERNR